MVGGEVMQGCSFKYGGGMAFLRMWHWSRDSGEAASHPGGEECPRQRHELGKDLEVALCLVCSRQLSGSSREWAWEDRAQGVSSRRSGPWWRPGFLCAGQHPGWRGQGRRLTRSDMCPTARSSWTLWEQTAGKPGGEAGNLSRGTAATQAGNGNGLGPPGWLETALKRSVWSLGPSDNRADKVS